MAAWGGPEVITERVRAHLDAGADHVCVQVLDPDPNGLPMASWRALTGGVPLVVEKRANAARTRMLCGGSDGRVGHLLVRLPVRR